MEIKINKPKYLDKLWYGKNAFRFRYDPMPWGCGSYISFRKTKWNKNYWASLQDVPKSIRKPRDILYNFRYRWDEDDFQSRSRSRSWKDQKKRKQWM